LALARNCGGVMIWEISQDVKGENSLVRAINDALAEHQAGGKSSTHSVN
jgi:GH18 family chitinase